MKKTCLYPFYEYTIKRWVVKGEKLPDYADVFGMQQALLNDSGSELEIRKEDIWNKTKRMLELPEQQRRSKLAELTDRTYECGLCLECQRCESYYWKQIEKVLVDNNGTQKKEKCEFLVPDAVKHLFEKSDRPVDVYLDFYKTRHIAEDDFLVMLKGFSSSTPILLNYAKNTNFYCGGGLYFRWKGLGVAVDPGYMFIQNLHNYGISVLDIDVVVVTHEHIDHSSDVRLLDDLHYNAAKNSRTKGISWDSNTFSLSNEKLSGHKIRWFLDAVTYEEAVLFQEKKSGFDLEYNDLFCVVMDDKGGIQLKTTSKREKPKIDHNWVTLSNDVSMKMFPTRHEQYEENDVRKFFTHTFGCVFEYADRVGNKKALGYTSDTSLHQDIVAQMHEAFAACQILIMNISGIYEDDILLQKSKDRHLGYYGCYELMEQLLSEPECKLQLCLLSEFTNMVSDIRYSIGRYMQGEINKLAERKGQRKVKVLPTEIGLTIDLSTLQTRCTVCDRYADKIYVLNSAAENAEIKYVCPDCLYSD